MKPTDKKPRPAWRPFIEARAYVRKLGLRTYADWREWAKSDQRPNDIPSDAYGIYKGKGWIDWGDWLGTRNRKKGYRSFDEARVYARKQKIQNSSEWKQWAKSDKRPVDIPSNPMGVYKNKGWVNWADWLGTKHQKGGYRVFKDARAFVLSLGLKNFDEWRVWAKSDARPNDIPASPYDFYKNRGWISWGDWLGTGRVADYKKTYRSFEDARNYARKLKLQGVSDWVAWSKTSNRPEDIPANPAGVYKNKGWINWGDWLGTDRVASFKKVYRSFYEARLFVRNIGLKSSLDWRKWAKSEKPQDIPADPARVYQNSGWISMGDWLGTTRIAPQNMIFRLYEHARDYARSLGLRNQDEWRKWAKSEERPVDIPLYPPSVYKNDGWKNWGDWLGTDYVSTKDRIYKPFEVARQFARTLKLANQSEWKKWTKEASIPKDIPKRPDTVYKNEGWISWGDWLGTGYVANQERVYRSYEEARAFVHTLGLKSQISWRKWSKSDARPSDIPAHPPRVYKGSGWTGWGDWLGTGRIANQNKIYLSFEEARTIVHNLSFKSQKIWNVWAKSSAKPYNIPASPRDHYYHNGWISWGDWLGTGYIAPRNRYYLKFKEARKFVRSLGLKSQNDWIAWAKTHARPNDVPADPSGVYKDKGWIGWSDWLGYVNAWNRNAILGFLYAIKPVLNILHPTELYAIMRQNGMITASKNSDNSNAHLITSIRDLCSSPNPEADFETLIAEIEREELLADEGVEEEPSVEAGIVEAAEENLPALRSMQALKAVDELVQAGITSDEETIEFLVSNRVSGLWQDTLNNGGVVNLESLRSEKGGVYFEIIRQRFFAQYDGAQSLPIPKGYDFRVKGELAPPNLMQKLAAYRILTEKRLGNWSGVGAGKTLSAILASQVIDAHLTVIIAFNSTVTPWAERVREAFPDSQILIKERGNISVDLKKHTYFILNFETFQQPDSAAMVERLVEKHKIDFVVLDEIQSVKQRTPKLTSKRRQVVSGLLTSASEKNPELCVLGMSATPVINNLYEAKALLELVKGVSFDELETFSNIPNAIAMHEKLILHGIRYRPEYKQTIETEIIEIQGNDFLSQLVKVRKGAILDLERVLLDAKMETILASLKKGTLIYTHYLTGLVTPLKHAIENAGFKVGLFTGDDKTGLEAFKKGKLDVLIGSVPVGTGVDGLQYVCNRMIIVSLPWTSAEYEQLIGRLYRQGSKFDKVDVIVPQVVLEHNGDIWSWDRMRMHRIQYKKTLADAAMDGVIPEGELSSPETMYKKAREALQAWIQRIEEDGLAVIERAQLKVPLPKETAHIIQRRFGDLSVMNSRINTAYSSTTHERLKESPEEWFLYHTLYREARKNWVEIPFEKIAKSLKKRPDWIIGDFGCGEAKLANMLSNKVYSFDHVAIHEQVTACDMSHVPLEDGVLDVAVFSLSLMGLNYADYLKEANRTLKFAGLLKIAEPLGRWESKRLELLSTIEAAGFSLVGNVEESAQFIYVDAIKKEL